MSPLSVILLLYAVGLIFLVAEIFLPSQGVLTVAGLGFLGTAVYKTFNTYGEQAGLFAILGCMVLLPALAYVAVKYWRQTPIGRKIVPPNPVLTNADIGVPVEKLSELIGKTGTTATPLRPVGICEFDGQRISCVAQFGSVEAGVPVVGVKLQSGNLAVRPSDA